MTIEALVMYIAAGGAIGFIMGCTGIGGGSLMMPALLAFGIPPQVAVGTDLMYASISKCSGLYSHQRQRNVRWDIVGRMCLGSLPATVLTLAWLQPLIKANNHADIITPALGVMLIITALVLILRHYMVRWADAHHARLSRHAPILTILTGALLGISVTLSSVGAGVVGTAVLMLIYTRCASREIVGTDVAHAVPLTFVAGMGHMFLGSIDVPLLLALLVGSLPAIHLGAVATRHIPERLLRGVLTLILLVLGIHYVIH